MNEIKLSTVQVQRLMDAILWNLAPYMDDNTIQDHPWLVELADCYNELYRQIPSVENSYEFISY
jgi:hypothetical protein